MYAVWEEVVCVHKSTTNVLLAYNYTRETIYYNNMNGFEKKGNYVRIAISMLHVTRQQE